MKKILTVIISLIILVLMSACGITAISGSREDVKSTIEIVNRLQTNQPTPTDIDYSLERYNLIRRTYWVNVQREKANSLPCEVEKPLGYIVLFTDNGGVIGSFIVDGKVSSLNSFLTPDSEYYERSEYRNKWLADVDGNLSSVCGTKEFRKRATLIHIHLKGIREFIFWQITQISTVKLACERVGQIRNREFLPAFLKRIDQVNNFPQFYRMNDRHTHKA